eukprot:1160814-Pelagomonas_calceolata.AAC.10
MTTAAPNTNQTLGGYTAGPGGPGGHLSGDGAAGNAGPSGVIHVGKLQMDLEAARRAALHAAAGAKTAEGLLLGLRQALPEWMENMRATVSASACARGGSPPGTQTHVCGVMQENNKRRKG